MENQEKQYTWEKDAQFVFSGQEFGLILNSVRAILNTPESAKILMLNQTNILLEQAMAKGIKEGIVKELEKKE